MKKIALILLAMSALGLGVWVNNAMKTDFSTLDGDTHRWSSYHGQWVIVNYFAEWCAPCLREIPELNHFHLQQHHGISLLGISFDFLEDGQLQALQKQFDIQYPLIQTIDVLPWQQRPSSLPTTYIIGPDGKVKRQLKGEQSAEKLLTIVRTLQDS